ncbi:unnamed protein product [Lactuca virosa]|uniref:Uncharacterized protein n=1 Tax=Lactuca virosa TaxID=75947 RepID=A0AAU9MVM5_9ASTR|nr:unnamed protein product [Lactuca virosa]
MEDDDNQTPPSVCMLGSKHPGLQSPTSKLSPDLHNLPSCRTTHQKQLRQLRPHFDSCHLLWSATGEFFAVVGVQFGFL